MSRESLILILGIVVFFTPWLGVPDTWKLYTLSACGAILFVTGYLLRRAAYLRRIDIGNGERGTDSFIESSIPTATDTVSEDSLLEHDEETA